MAKQYAVIMAEGWFQENRTEVLSAHSTAKLALRAAATHRVSIPGDKPNRQCTTVIYSEDGLHRGQTIYGDTIRSVYPIVTAADAEVRR